MQKMAMLVSVITLCFMVSLNQAVAKTNKAEEPDLSPPPMPDFMLRKPGPPLTMQQMQRQADAAAEKARANKSSAQSGKKAKQKKSHKPTQKLAAPPANSPAPQ